MLEGNSEPSAYLCNGDHAACRVFQLPVSHDRCQAPRPVRSEPCYVPCHNDCVLSAWSHWSACSESCDGHAATGYRSRQRMQLAAASEG